ncbi:MULTISPECIES: hypothetical protein [Streptomyces]|uniref:hypothetical protein n=1 Tax=Streptomyces TaxID=1883 RepID=UPI0029C14CB5|nr:hypothetical protein [Streptomyces sp. ID01-9D]MDX5574356.1 hypothetical protein [Streptomyces sp. ID01-9D]WSV23146.1 hypothetical protein OG554_23500 [Streptomyces fimicarius]
MRTVEKKRPYGLSLLLSTVILLLEATLALVVAVLYGLTQESSAMAPTGGSPLSVVLLPLFALWAATIAAALSVALVLPTAWLSDVLGRRFGGREVWWWVPVVAAAVSLLTVGGVVGLSGGGAGPLALATGWFLTTAALTVPALLCRSRRKRVFGPVTLWGVTAVALTAVLGGVSLGTGVLTMYEPPALARTELVGTWSDGRGGTLTLSADGRATTSGIDDSPGDNRKGCTGEGTWGYGTGTSRQYRGVGVDVPTCGREVWNVGGTEDRPVLHRNVLRSVERDDADRYELTRAAAR